MYQNGNYGLLRGHNKLNGAPIYVPFFNGLRAKVSLDGYTGAGLSGAQREELHTAMDALEAADAKNHANNPFVKYNDKGLAISQSIPEKLAKVVAGWKDLLVPNVKLYVTTVEDARNNRDVLTGPERAVSSAALDPNEAGSARYIGNDTYYIAIDPNDNVTRTLELLGHEMGHVHEKDVFRKADTDTQDAIRAEHKKWLSDQKDKSARELITALRAYEIGKSTNVQDGLSADQLGYYWKSFSEWYADQVSRWAVSDDKPVSVVQKFFAKVGAQLRKFYQTLRGQGFLPTETFRRYLNDTTKNLDLTPSAEPTTEASAARVSVEPPKNPQEADQQISKGMQQVELSEKQLYGAGEPNKEASIKAISGILGNVASHDFDAFKDKFVAAFKSMDIPTLITLTKLLPTSGLVDWAASIGAPAIRRMQDVADQINGYRTGLRQGVTHLGTQFANWVQTNGMKEIGRAMHLARLNAVDFTAHATAADAIKADSVIPQYRGLIADPDATIGQKKKYQALITKREVMINDAYKAWDALGKKPGGQDMFLKIRQFYKDMYHAQRTGLDDNIQNLDIKDDAAKKKLIADIRRFHERELGSVHQGEFPGVDTSGLPSEYFPLGRYGDYWLRVMDGPTGREMYKFESVKKRDAFLRERARELGKDPNDDTVFKTGHDDATLKNQLLNESPLLKQMFATIDSMKNASPASLEELKDNLYQHYLMSLPERSIRKSFLHADNITGFSADVLKDFGVSATKYVSQLTRMKYGPQVNRTIEEVRGSLSGMPRDQQEKLNIFVDSVGNRLREYLTPTLGVDKFSTIDRAEYLYWLASVKQGMSHMFNVPLFLFPELMVNHGAVRAAAKIAKFMNIFNAVGTTRTYADGTHTFVGPTLDDSPIVKSNPVLARAMALARDTFGIFNTVAEQRVLGENTPVTARAKRAQGITHATLTGMSALFSTMERLTRQLAFAASFELRYEDALKAGKNPEVAFQEAHEAARGTVRNTMGAFNQFERPPFAKKGIWRAATMLRSWTANETRFFANNLSSILRTTATPAERAKGMMWLGSVLLMGSLFSGVKGLPLFSTVGHALDLAQYFSNDPDERKRRAKDPLSALSSTDRFLHEWLPNHFGTVALPGLDGRQHALSKVFENGFVSELSGVDLGESASFDHMWFHDGKPAKDITEAVGNFIQANLPWDINVTDDFTAAIDDINAGRVERGLEELSPGALRGFVKAARYATEGAKDPYNLETLVPAKDISGLAIVGAAMGYTPTQVGEVQEQRRLDSNEKKVQENERQEALDFFANAMLTKGDTKAAMNKVMEYNSRFPAMGYVITAETLEGSLRDRAQKMYQTINGIPINMKEPWTVAHTLNANPTPK